MSFIYKSIHTGVFRVFKIIVGIFISAIIARELGPHNKGLLAVITLIPTFIVLFGGLGIEISNVYFIPQNKNNASKYYSNSIVIAAILSIIFIPIGLIIFYLFRIRWFSEVSAHYLLYSLILIPTGLITKYLNGVILGFNKIEISNKIGFFIDIINLICLITISIVYKLSVGWMILIINFLNFSNLFFELYYLKKEIRLDLKIKPDFKGLKPFFSYGIKGHLANVLSFFNYRLDMFLIMYFLNATALGIYTIAVAVAEKLWLLPDILSSVLFLHISNFKDKDLTAFLSRIVFFIMALISIIIILIGKYLIVLVYGDAFVKSFYPLLFLLPGIIFLSIGKLIASDVMGRGYSHVTLISSSIAAITNLILNLILIPRYGLSGAALSSAFSYSLHTLYMINQYLHITKNSWKDVFLLKKSDVVYLLNAIKMFLAGKNKI